MAENLIDVHIIHMPNENKEWWAECEASLVGQPINIFHIEGKPGDVLYGRETGYRQGTAPYVSYVDPDDIVMPGAFQRCLDEITTGNYCGVYTMSTVIEEGQPDRQFHNFREWTIENSRYHLTEVHQIMVMHRSMVIDIFDNHKSDFIATNSTEFVTTAHLAVKAPWKAVDFVGYKWRKHAAGHHATVARDQRLLYDTLNRIYRSALK